MKNKIAKGLSGVAGEYFVAGELSRLGFIATVTLRNTRGIDILATNEDGTRYVGIQVKTNQKHKRDWVLTKKAETLFATNLFYIFVNLNGQSNQPTYHIVPSKVVATHCKVSHLEWLTNPGAKGQKRNDNTMRKFSDIDGQYLDAWNLLDL